MASAVVLSCIYCTCIPVFHSHSVIVVVWLCFQSATDNNRAQIFQGVTERLQGGVQVQQIDGVIVECLRFFCSEYAQPPALVPPLKLCSLASNQALPLNPHTHFILSALRVEPAQSCQSASLCQPNYHTHLKGVKSSSELPGVAFPV